MSGSRLTFDLTLQVLSACVISKFESRRAPAAHSCQVAEEERTPEVGL